MMGQCAWMTCDSALGHEFRANFRRLHRGRLRKAVTICKEHEYACDAIKERDELWISPEGWVYESALMAAI